MIYNHYSFMCTFYGIDPMFYTCLDARKESNDIWHLGNGCSNHITGNRDCFVNLDEKVSSQ